MLSTELEYICTGLKCFLEGWNAFDRVGSPLYMVEMLCRVFESFLQGWNAFDSVGMLSTMLIYLVQSCNDF
jgi:hypothetical protein